MWVRKTESVCVCVGDRERELKTSRKSEDEDVLMTTPRLFFDGRDKRGEND